MVTNNEDELTIATSNRIDGVCGTRIGKRKMAKKMKTPKPRETVGGWEYELC